MFLRLPVVALMRLFSYKGIVSRSVSGFKYQKSSPALGRQGYDLSAVGWFLHIASAFWTPTLYTCAPAFGTHFGVIRIIPSGVFIVAINPAIFTPQF
jgi:hypothetical protein